VKRRPRTSTLIISGLFLAVLALYILVRPVPVPAATVQQGATSTVTPTVTPTPTRSVPTPTRTPSPTRSPSVSPSATPSGSVTAPASPAPSGSLTTGPTVLNPLPTTGASTPAG
jgi:cytoskeletal protein RodZ